MLKEQYYDNPACQLAVGASAVGVISDTFNTEGTGTIDSLGHFALMRCVGKSWSFIISYCLVLICIIAVCAVSISHAIPDSIWQNCTICTKHKSETVYKRGRRESRSVYNI